MGVGVKPVWLDYGNPEGQHKLLTNLSAIAWDDTFLWTASDEGRSVECLKPYRDGFRLHRRFALDDLFLGLPGSESADEIDVESMDVVGGRLWVCGSHCTVRRQAKKTGSLTIDPDLRARKSRRLLGSALLAGILDQAAVGLAMPYSGKDSLRRRLSNDPYLAPFLNLPGKENGLDIEGLAVRNRAVLIGLRGPIVDSTAVVVEFGSEGSGEITPASHRLHFLELEGLGVRDLARWDGSIIVLAGPVSSAAGPFRLYLWNVRRTDKIQRPRQIFEWKEKNDAPEGICRKGDELLVVYDTGRDMSRIQGGRFRADRLVGLLKNA
ncbi:DUF3616 domain-containing protein [Bradyrhizobium barranii]|uniref:DUF3616 domain-containing protein n=1 Tax=Bradyrhizobium barranii TaxID=2992140 RepID=UPI0024B126B7|nr:DUF3616 domain-containing protein [Bradyrhizobium barranii]WFT97008.1 DUF3616 domain-containing protein [Bradyrhizobium barranii]